MKKDIVMVTELESGKILSPVFRKTEKGVSDYANRMWNKYGDGVTVRQYHFDDEHNLILDAKWHA